MKTNRIKNIFIQRTRHSVVETRRAPSLLRRIAFLPGVALLMCACTGPDDISGPDNNPSGAILFSTEDETNMLLRLDDTSTGSGSSSSIRTFAVNAIHSSNTMAAGYLLNEVVVSRIGNNTWQYAPVAVYPQNGGANSHIDFFAYSPAGAKGLHTGLKDNPQTPDGSNYPELMYEVLPPDSTGNQEDFLVAYQKVSATTEGSAGNYSYPYKNLPVKLQFRHALSRVQVQVVQAEFLAKKEIYIDSLKLVGLKCKGKLVMSNDTSTWDRISNGIPPTVSPWKYGDMINLELPGRYFYDPHDNRDSSYVVLWKVIPNSPVQTLSYTLPAGGIHLEPLQPERIEQGLLVLPQSTGAEFKLHVYYRVSDVEDAEDIPDKSANVLVTIEDFNELVDKGSNDVPYGITFEIGRQYVIDIQFVPDPGNTTGVTAINRKIVTSTTTENPENPENSENPTQ